MTAGVERRWGQLTYTSFDDGVGPGGWQVKQTTGALTEEEQNRLCADVVTHLHLLDDLPRFATPDEIAALPRRLVYASDAQRCGRYWHTGFAGPDATGRPGNVFVHAVLDRDVTAAETVPRPVQLWRSPDWLTPYGADEVRAAQLPAGERPRSGDSVTVERVVEFVLDPAEWRIGVLGTVLDAVSAASAGAGKVVLGTESTDAAALWIGAVSLFMAPSAARRFGWSTYERAAELDSAWRRGIELAAIPFTDMSDVDLEAGVVLIDSSEAVSLGTLGADPHTTSAGSSIKVTAWSVLAETALQDPTTALAVLHGIDDVASSLTLAPGPLEWPLAAAMSLMPGRFADCETLIRTALLDGPPVDLHRLPKLASIVAEEMRERIGGSAEEAWRQLSSGRQGSLRALAVQSYFTLATGDQSWLAQAGGAPVPSAAEGATAANARSYEDAMTAALDGIVAAPEHESVPAIADALRLLDFGVRAGVVHCDKDGVVGASGRFVRDCLAPCLSGGVGESLVALIEPPRDPTLARVIAAAVDAAIEGAFPGRPLAARDIDDTVLQWLYNAGLPMLNVDMLAEDLINRRGPGPTAAAWIVHWAHTSADELARFPWVVPCALQLAMHAESHEPALASLVEDLADRSVAADELRILLRDFGTAVPPQLVLDCLARERWVSAAPVADSTSRLDPDRGRWGAGSFAPTVRALARLRSAAYARDRRTAAWGAEVLHNALAIRNLTTPLGREVRSELLRVVVAAGFTCALVEAKAALADANTPDSSRYLTGTAVRWTPTQDPLYRAGADVEEFVADWTPGMPADRPRPTLPPLADAFMLTEAMWRSLAATVNSMAPAELAEAVLPDFADGAIEPETAFAAAVVGPPDCPLSQLDRLAVLRRLYGLRLASHASAVEALVTELIRSDLSLDAKALDSLSDRLGRAEYGLSRWEMRPNDRADLTKWTRRRWKELQSGADAGHSRGMSRRARGAASGREAN